MTRDVVERWLASREPARPESLSREMSRSLAACPQSALSAAASVAEAMGMLGTWTLATIAGSDGHSSELALQLLSADAFVTYAFEAAAEEGLAIGSLALQLLRQAA